MFFFKQAVYTSILKKINLDSLRANILSLVRS